MADEFDKYIVKKETNSLGTDEFEQYRVTPAVSTPPPAPPPQQQGFLSNVGADLSKRWKNIGGQSLLRPEGVYRDVGQVAGGIQDVLDEGVKSLYKTVVPEKAQAAVSKGAQAVLNTSLGKVGISALQKGQKYWDLFKKTYPNVAADIEATVNIASLLPIGKGAKITEEGVVAAGKEGTAIVGDIATKLIPATEKELNSAIKKGIDKTILTTRGKKADPQVIKFMNNAQTAVKDIITNKEKLKFTDIEGNVVKGQAPKSLSDFREAVSQRKAAIWQQVEAINKEGGKKQIQISLKELSDKLLTYATDSAVMTENPTASKYALEKAALYEKQKFYTVEEAQKALTELNKRFEMYIKNPTAEKEVDIISGNNIRNLIDSEMAKLEGGANYQQLKKTYGSLTAIENDVTKKSLQDIAKVRGPQWLDILAGAEFVSGVLTMQPAAMVRGGMLESFNTARRWYKNPNRFVKNMFEDADKTMQRIERQKNFKPDSKLIQAIQ
jgi:hypothetical protein